MASNGRINHNFQISHFIAGSCHTPDAAYAVLCDLRDDRKRALFKAESGKLRLKAKLVKLERDLKSDLEDIRLEAEADLLDIKNEEDFNNKLIEAAQQELDYINKCIEQIQSYRKYAHLSDLEANEAMQYDEWKLELINRAKTYLITTGTIPQDHFNTMLLHPAFEESILPAINETKQLMLNNSDEDLMKIMKQGVSGIVNLLEYKVT